MNKLQLLRKAIPFRVNKEFKFGGDKDICLVYSLWSHREYVNIALYSIMSQLCYTDILKYNIVIFVDRHIADYTKNIFRGIIPEENIIVLSGPECSKQRVCIHPRLQEFKTIVISDADNIIQSLRPNPVYSTIFSFEPDKLVTFLKSLQNGVEVLGERKFLCDFKTEEDYNKFFKELKSALIKGDIWYLSGFMSYPSALIKEFIPIVEECIPHSIFCDETVWLKFLYSDKGKDVKIQEFESLENFKFITNENLYELKKKKENVTYLVHPFLHNFESSMQNEVLENVIETSKLL